ncbi:nucleoside deaminase [Legionella spiritensis]|uniref:Cytosine deaminase n=1 Tax=Legionella spiritensis TaxID=452 RepID=A0A0W0Z597_LEGSP|nr:nucleoside deaminase [Legionella spiritensis]KTD64308.1 cytosine deaminase [Legionella spiritensis]SNV46722.1 cytosine deaminase [Legionella spiritensis]
MSGSHRRYLEAAIEEARQSLAQGGIPIGSVLVYQDKIIGRGHNQRVQKGSAILHGEMDALEKAGRQPAKVYEQSILYTTLSPCPMCSGAILLYKIPHVVIGENQTFMGDESLLASRGVKVEVLQNEQCVALMRAFIAQNNSLWNEDIGETDKSPSTQAL